MPRILLIIFLAIMCCSMASCYLKNYQQYRKPRIFGNKLPIKSLRTQNSKVMKKIVLYHNFFRAKVEPPASNMLAMHWHEGAAESAQSWADQCVHLQHNPAYQRHIENYGNCGQNIFVATHKVPWFFAIKIWFLEYHNFTYGSPFNNLKVVGHYTQMVWATTHEVGCGFTRCPSGGPGGRPFFNYVCNYCPTGNWDTKIGKPYKTGKPCSRCPRSCDKGKLCTNSCSYADTWSNCRQLKAVGEGWLCGTSTSDGLQRQKSCRATCFCKNRIHEWR